MCVYMYLSKTISLNLKLEAFVEPFEGKILHYGVLFKKTHLNSAHYGGRRFGVFLLKLNGSFFRLDCFTETIPPPNQL